MKALTLILFVPLLTLLPSCSSPKDTSTIAPIGIYDSRAVAIAFAGSPPHEKKLTSLMEKRQKAKKSGDQATVAKLEAQGQAMQKKAHQQAFGTAPVDEIIDLIPDKISTIKQQAGVTHLVSKWDQVTLKQHQGAQHIDLTMKLVDALSPTAQQRERAIGILNKKPVSAPLSPPD